MRCKGAESINCQCGMKQPVILLGIVDKKQPCKACHKHIHSSYWYPATELQKLARERNWDIVQVKGAIGNLCRISITRGHPNIPTEFVEMQRMFLAAIDADWKSKRQKFIDKEKLKGFEI